MKGCTSSSIESGKRGVLQLDFCRVPGVIVTWQFQVDCPALIASPASTTTVITRAASLLLSTTTRCMILQSVLTQRSVR